MTSIRTRPLFKHTSPLPLGEIKNKLLIQLANKTTLEKGITGKVYQEHLSLDIIKSKQHFWSPHLNVNFEETDEGVILRGRYGPQPSLWTIFMFAYGALGILFLFISLYGFSQKALHQEAPILWSLPFIGAGIAFLWLSGQTGQKLGVEQTFILHHFLEDSIEEQIHIH